MPEGASILGFLPNAGCMTIYKNVYSRKKWSGSAPSQLNSIRTHLSDLTADRYSCERQFKRIPFQDYYVMQITVESRFRGRLSVC